MSRLKDPAAIRRIAKKSLFEGLDHMTEGAIIVKSAADLVIDNTGDLAALHDRVDSVWAELANRS